MITILSLIIVYWQYICFIYNYISDCFLKLQSVTEFVISQWFILYNHLNDYSFNDPQFWAVLLTSTSFFYFIFDILLLSHYFLKFLRLITYLLITTTVKIILFLFGWINLIFTKILFLDFIIHYYSKIEIFKTSTNFWFFTKNNYDKYFSILNSWYIQTTLIFSNYYSIIVKLIKFFLKWYIKWYWWNIKYNLNLFLDNLILDFPFIRIFFTNNYRTSLAVIWIILVFFGFKSILLLLLTMLSIWLYWRFIIKYINKLFYLLLFIIRIFFILGWVWSYFGIFTSSLRPFNRVLFLLEYPINTTSKSFTELLYSFWYIYSGLSSIWLFYTIFFYFFMILIFCINLYIKYVQNRYSCLEFNGNLDDCYSFREWLYKKRSRFELASLFAIPVGSLAHSGLEFDFSDSHINNYHYNEELNNIFNDKSYDYGNYTDLLNKSSNDYYIPNTELKNISTNIKDRTETQHSNTCIYDSFNRNYCIQYIRSQTNWFYQSIFPSNLHVECEGIAGLRLIHYKRDNSVGEKLLIISRGYSYMSGIFTYSKHTYNGSTLARKTFDVSFIRDWRCDNIIFLECNYFQQINRLRTIWQPANTVRGNPIIVDIWPPKNIPDSNIPPRFSNYENILTLNVLFRNKQRNYINYGGIDTLLRLKSRDIRDFWHIIDYLDPFQNIPLRPTQNINTENIKAWGYAWERFLYDRNPDEYTALIGPQYDLSKNSNIEWTHILELIDFYQLCDASLELYNHIVREHPVLRKQLWSSCLSSRNIILHFTNDFIWNYRYLKANGLPVPRWSINNQNPITNDFIDYIETSAWTKRQMPVVYRFDVKYLSYLTL